jgi:hypothetical protein
LHQVELEFDVGLPALEEFKPETQLLDVLQDLVLVQVENAHHFDDKKLLGDVMGGHQLDVEFVPKDHGFGDDFVDIRHLLFLLNKQPLEVIFVHLLLLL